MAIVNRYAQAGDPGAVGAGSEWVNTSTGDISVRNLSNTGWVLSGNLGQTTLGLVSRSGDTMTGPLVGVTGWAPLTAPDFQTSAKLNGLDLATQQYVNVQITALSNLINTKISETIVTVQRTFDLPANITVDKGETLYGAGSISDTTLTIPLPVFSDGSTATADQVLLHMAFLMQTSEDDDGFNTHSVTLLDWNNRTYTVSHNKTNNQASFYTRVGWFIIAVR